MSLGRVTRRHVLVGLLLALAVLLAGYGVMRSDASPDAIVAYKQIRHRSLSLHVFASSIGEHFGRRPAALLLFHGGGWKHGSPAQFYPQCRYFSQIGITCISVEYRTESGHGGTPEDAVEDANDALRHVLTHATTLNIDGARVAAGGGSAGGLLAAALGTGIGAARIEGLHLSNDKASIRPVALVLFNPILDLSPGTPDHASVGENWRALSPLHHVDADTPRTLVLNGTADPEVPVATVEAFCQALHRAGAICELALFEDAGHGFFNPHIDGGKHFAPANHLTERFLKSAGLLRAP